MNNIKLRIITCKNKFVSNIVVARGDERYVKLFSLPTFEAQRLQKEFQEGKIQEGIDQSPYSITLVNELKKIGLSVC